jgi:hypothetical protein
MKKLKHIKLFEFFTSNYEKEELSSSNEKNEELYKFIDSLRIEDYIKKSLKNNQDLLIIWNKYNIYKNGIQYLMKLFESVTIDYWNEYINDLGQDSYIKEFYSDVDEFIEVLDRIHKFVKHPESSYIFTNIFGYCHAPALRYLTEKSIINILKNKDLIKKFQALWVQKLNISSDSGDYEGVSSWNSKLTGIKPFVPTSDKEQDEKIEEIIMDKYSKI